MTLTEQTEDDYVAWCRYTNYDTIRLCSSDSDGAFRVYRWHKAKMQPKEAPDSPGRWAWISKGAITAANGVADLEQHHLDYYSDHTHLQWWKLADLPGDSE